MIHIFLKKGDGELLDAVTSDVDHWSEGKPRCVPKKRHDGQLGTPVIYRVKNPADDYIQ